MDPPPPSRKLFAAVGLVLVLAAFGAWLAMRPPVGLRKLVRHGDAGLERGSGAAPSPPSEGEAVPAELPGADGGGSEATAVPVTGEAEGTETLSGVVVTPEGKPIPGARVDVASSAGPPATPQAPGGRTDAAGRFDIGGLARGHHDLEVTARGFGMARVRGAPTPGAALREGTLRIVLHPELFLEGEVVDRQGQAIAGADVTLTFLGADAGELQPLPAAAPAHRTRTDAGGRFRLGGLGRGMYRAEARGEGYSKGIPRLVEVHDPDTARRTRVVFELDEARALRGIVRSEGGEPIAGARVLLRPRPAGPGVEAIAGRGREVHAATSGPGGAFEVEDLPEETFRLVVSASGHVDRTVKDVATGGEPIEVVLEPRLPLEGRVVDRRSGDPVPDAEVRWQTAEGMDVESGPPERTDAAGRFRTERFPEYGEALEIVAEGYAALWVDAAPPEDGSVWTLALERSGSVSGRVRAARSLPVDGLRVSLVRLPNAEAGLSPEILEEIELSPYVSARSSTDAAGLYRVLLPGSGSYRVLVEGEPYAATTSEVLTAPDDQAQIERVDISLELAATVQGIVFSPGIGHVSGARVRVIPDQPPEDGAEPAVFPRGHAEVRADAMGAFTVSGLRAGAHRVIAGAPGFVTTLSESFHLAAGGMHVVELELEPEMMITGRVADPGGAPIPLAEIHAVATGERGGEYWSEERSLSGADGSFRLSRLAARPYDLRISAHGFAPAVLESVAAGSGDVVVRLDPLVSISGRVLGAVTGEPAVEFRLRLQFGEEHRLSSLEKQSLHAWRRFSDPGGAFRIDRVPPGLYLVEATAHGHIGAGPRELEVPVEGLEDAEILLEETGLITGIVLDAHQNGISGARVEALGRVTDPDTGLVSFRPITLPRPPGEEDEGDSPGGGGGRRGRGRDREGRNGDRSPAAVMTRDDGTFVLRGLPDGVYRVSVTHDDYLARELGDYVFENGRSGHEPLRLSFLLPFGVVLLGKVRGVDAGGSTIGVILRPVAADPDSRARRRTRGKSARVDDSGHFEMRGLEVGDYVLQASFRRADGSRVSIRRDVRIHGAGREQGILLDFSR
jgi:protocatechuate 3,4-dioxygenase beta subunit